jgi:putative Mg2+ transporter-C (MgtC) family protein
MNMPLNPTWTDIAIRLALTMLAGATIGFNRGARGHAAGFRTDHPGRPRGFGCDDSGQYPALPRRQNTGFIFGHGPDASAFGYPHRCGFIGGGAIVRKGDLVVGVTTTATLWVVTVIGLCLGG